MTVTCTRILEFDAGHRVLGHESKCANLHGHRYKAEVTCQAAELDSVGRVIDFSVIKDVFGRWIDDELDHNMILNEDDPLYCLWESENNEELLFNGKEPAFCSVQRVDGGIQNLNPTAENIAQMLFEQGNRLLQPKGVRVVHIKLWETPNCFASYPNIQEHSHPRQWSSTDIIGPGLIHQEQQWHTAKEHKSAIGSGGMSFLSVKE